VKAVREPPRATWSPPSHAKEYFRERNLFFNARSEAAKNAGGTKLHPGELWGIKELRLSEGTEGTSLRLITTRITYPDFLFLSANLDVNFPNLRKTTTYRQWLDIDPNPHDEFCAPRDALCVSVVLVCQKPKLSAFVARQCARRADGSAIWETSAAGAASSSQLHYLEEHPDLEAQVQSVVLRETGVQFDPKSIRWLGFARSAMPGNSSAIALVELPQAVPEVVRRFRDRREHEDVDELFAVELAKAQDWLQSTPQKERGEFLELALALTGIRYGVAQVC
jgi:hypothetical protein